MSNWRFRSQIAGIFFLAGCASAAPSWYGDATRFDRGIGYEQFMVANGRAIGSARNDACADADGRAMVDMIELLVTTSETQGNIVAAAGGPSRLRNSIETFARVDGARATRTQEHYDHATETCWVQLHWLLPQHLDVAIRRAVFGRPTEEDVGQQLRRALAAGDGDTRPVEAAPPAGAPNANAAVTRAYPGWYVRILRIPECPSHRRAFVGAPGGTESRWLELKEASSGWIIIDDQVLSGEGWPEIPAAVACE